MYTLLKPTVLILSLLFSQWITAQNDNFPFAMGIPEGEDTEYQELPVKARLTNENYRSVGSKASLEKYAPTPQSQGNYGTCTAWAAGYCGRTILEAQRLELTSIAEINQNAFSIGFLYRISSAAADCNGAFVSKTMEQLRDVGVPKAADFKEDCPQGTLPRDLYTKAANYKIKGFATLWNTNNPATLKQSVQLVKKSISEGNPVVIAMIVPTSFCQMQTDIWTPDVNDRPSGNQGHAHGRHAMCIIGYDDDKHGGAFLVQNSWGTYWGNKGRIWIKYKDAADYIYQAVEMFKLPVVKKQPTDIVQADKDPVVLAGSMQLIEDTQQEMTATLQKDNSYKMNKAYRSGTRFRFYLNNNRTAYVYAIGSDLSHKTFQLFPHKKGISPMLNYSYSSVPIPSTTEHIRLDGNTGTDYICVLYSDQPIDLDDLRQNIQRQSNYYTFEQKVKKALGNRLVPAKDIQYVKQKMGFHATSTSGSVVPLFMEMEHID